jgi:hypothetical protein
MIWPISQKVPSKLKHKKHSFKIIIKKINYNNDQKIKNPNKQITNPVKPKKSQHNVIKKLLLIKKTVTF